ncbi:MAG: glycosyltransferase family 4 protein [Chloroflexi bacterium]|nr:glycosyltransferase family 4 protein [Chloroflexota bacterium]
MKLLVIGNSYVTTFAQQKYLAMKQLDHSLQLRIAVPPDMGHIFQQYKLEVALGLETDLIPLKKVWGNSTMNYVLNPVGLAQLIREFRPDHVHIEEDPHSLVGVEAVILTSLFASKAKISFFIWDNLARKPKFPLNIIKIAFTKFSFSRSNLVVCGNKEGQQLLKTVKGYSGSSVVLPQVGLDLCDYNLTPDLKIQKLLQIESGVPTIGFAGRLVPEKGIMLLLEALYTLQDLPWKMVILGSGPLSDEINTHWKRLFRDRLVMLGVVPLRAVADYLKCFDIFVLPSYSTPKWKEQFGLVLAQAMMAGNACIGSSSGAIPEVLGSAGLVFPERDKAGLVLALTTLLQSKDLRQSLGVEARIYASQYYTNSTIAEAYLHHFKI